MDDLDLAKAIIGRLTKAQLDDLKQHILRLENVQLPPPIPPTQTTNEPSHTGLFIEFCETNAASFGQALAIARGAPNYGTREELKKKWHWAEWPDANLEHSLPLVAAISGLKNKRCTIGGRERDWTEVFGFASCAIDRARAYRPNNYCFGRDNRNPNPWGCVHARMEWSEWARWFRYGRFEKQGFLAGNRLIWTFDKKHIRHELESNIFNFRFCPHLNIRLIEAVLDALPDQLDVEKNADWTYHESYDAIPGRPKIIQREQHEDYTTTNEFYADGVRPVGLNAFRELLRKSFKKAQLPENLLAELLT